MDEGEETDEDSEQFCFPFKSGRPPEPSSTQTSDDTLADGVKEPDELRKDLRARTLAAARTPAEYFVSRDKRHAVAALLKMLGILEEHGERAIKEAPQSAWDPVCIIWI